MPEVSSHLHFPATWAHESQRSMTAENKKDNRQSSSTFQKIGALHHSIDLALIPVYLEPPSIIGCLGYYPSDETSARLPDVFLSSQDVCAQHSATMQKHFAMVEGNLYKVLESLVRFVEGGERAWGS
jgi:hypothetical protein